MRKIENRSRRCSMRKSGRNSMKKSGEDSYSGRKSGQKKSESKS